MKFNPDSMRPDNTGASRDSAQNPHLTVTVAVRIARPPAEAGTPNTLTERVLMFLDHHAA